jgi:hypothetical protein
VAIADDQAGDAQEVAAVVHVQPGYHKILSR